MKLISWNIRGINSKGKMRYLKERIQKEQFDILIIQETKVTRERFKEIANENWPLVDCMALDARDSAGGPGILWDPRSIAFDKWMANSYSLTGKFECIGTLEKGTFFQAKILPCMGSGHWPICLEIDLQMAPQNRSFRFGSLSLGRSDLLPKMEEWWGASRARVRNLMETFQLKLKELKRKIKAWNKTYFGNIHWEKHCLEEAMQSLQQQIILEGQTEDHIVQEGEILNALEYRQKQEEILWKQKSRVQWLREGERNTKFFHRTMIKHRHFNRIFSLKDQEVRRLVYHEEITKELV
eukprot:PITA_17518